MPELPEVETVRRQLEKEVVGRTIQGVTVRFGGRLNLKPVAFGKAVVGARVVSVARRAKLLLIGLSNGMTMVVHLKMTGRFRLVPADTGPGPHVHVVFRLSRKQDLFFEDVRKFGFIRVYPDEELPEVLARQSYGPEPLEPGFGDAEFGACLRRRAGKRIKAALIDQTCVAGVGNIYADESLWRAGIRPERKAGGLKPKEIGALRRGLLTSLKLSLRHRGTSSEDFLDLYGRPGDNVSRLKVYGRGGQPCPRCRRPLLKKKVAGRSAHWCRHCQK
jgi:formamidopyrimidine-DNA glycosylase